MTTVNGVKYYTISEVAKRVGRSAATILNWYKAEEYAQQTENLLSVQLPRPVRDFDLKCSRYWTEEGVLQLIHFRDNINRGELAQYNCYLWGERGQHLRERNQARKVTKKGIQ